MTTFKAIWFVIMILGFAVCGWLCIFRTNMLVTWGRKNAKTKFAWSLFERTHEASVSHIHSLRGSLHLALGNRPHICSGFPSFPIACGNQTDPLPKARC